MNKSKKEKSSYISKIISNAFRFLKKSRMKIAALVMVIVTLISSTPAYALSVGDSASVERTWVPGVEYNFDFHGNHWGQLPVLKIKSTGEPLYCLEPHESINLSASATAKNISGTDVWKNLSAKQKDIITRASIYGCDGSSSSSYGYSVLEARAATQLIIWDAIMGYRTDYSHGIKSWVTSCTSNIKNCYNAILDEMKNHTVVPTFSSNTVTLTGTGSSNAKTITDTKGVLSDFDIGACTNSKIHVTRDGTTKLKIWCDTAGNYSGTITLTKKGTNIGSSLALTGAEQTVLYGKISDPVNAPITVNVQALKCNISVAKQDLESNAILDGASFKVQQWSNSQNKYVDYKTLSATEYNGSRRYTASNLEYTDDNAGWFKLVETGAPAGYELKPTFIPGASYTTDSAKTPGVFRLTDAMNGKTFNFTVKDPPIKANVKFQKFWAHTDANGNLVDENNNFINATHLLGNSSDEITILNSLNLEVRQYNKETSRYEPTGIPLTFDKETKYFEAKGLTYTDKNQGWFKIYENYNGTAKPIALIADTSQMVMKWNNANGYKINNFGAFKIHIDENGNKISNKTFYLYYTDPIQYGDVVIKKSSDDNFVKGIEFLLEGTSTLGEKISITTKTNKDGIAEFSKVPVGNYSVTELATDEMREVYIIPDATEPFEVLWDEESDVDVYNKLKTEPLTVRKISEDGKVEGVKIHLYGQALCGAMIDEYAVTDKNGIAVFDHCTLKNSNFAKTEYDGILVGNHFTVEEVDVDAWYIQPAPLTDVKIEYGKDNTVTFENILKRGNLDVQKVITDYAENSKASLEGFGFRLTGTSWSGETINEYAVTDKNGVAHFKNILISNPNKGYTFHEETYQDWYTPEGDKTVYIEYNTTKDPVTYTYTNTPTRGSLEVQKVIENIPENAKTPITDLSGFEFTLKGTSDSGDKVNMHLTTGKNGKVTFSDVLIGTYELFESAYPSWYNPQYPDGLTVRIDNNGGKPIKVSFDNYFKRGSLEVQKDIKNISNNVLEFVKDLSGFEFTLSGTSDSGNKINLKAVTDKNGKVKFNDVLIGTYILRETKFPSWHTPQYPDGLEVRITENNGEPIKVNFDNYPKLGDLIVIKAAEDGVKEGFKFRLHGLSIAGSDKGLTGEDVDITLATNSEGWVVFNNIPIGVYTLDEVDTNIKYVQPASQKVTINWNEKTELWAGKDEFSKDKASVAHFDNALKKFRAEVTKYDSEKIAHQGDATLEGAVYGIYKGNKLVDTYTTDAEGKFTTKYYICDNDWTIKEIEPSEGYLLDETVYKVGAEPKLYEVEYNNAPEIESPEDVIKGSIAIIKHSDNGETQIERPEVGAEFEIYLKSAGSYKKADSDERDVLVCDEYGFAQSKLLPYGVYTVHQRKGWDGRDLMPDFDVYIAENGKVYRFLINNSYLESYLKIVKTVADNNKPVLYAGAGFQIYDPNGNLVSMQITYPTPMVIDTFYTNSEGYLVTPQKLEYGKGYEIVEVQSPYGCVLNSTPIKFDITEETAVFEDALAIVTIERLNELQMGTIEINKSGAVFSTVEKTDDVYTPIFEEHALANTVFEIFAAEDIVTPDGEVRLRKGELADTVTTDENGRAISKKLYLGQYLVKEKTASFSFVLNTDEYPVELSYKGQHVEVTSASISVFNERQRVSVSLEKVIESDKLFEIGMNDEIKSIRFGLFVNEDITAADGSVIPQDSLISSAYCDENGMITFDCDLPIGFKWYVREISADEHYIVSDDKYEFETEYQGQETDHYVIEINNGKPIENTLKRSSVIGYKTDRETGNSIKGALFGLFKATETEFTRDNAFMTDKSNRKGIFTFKDVPTGNYLIKELKPGKNYLPNDELYAVTIFENEEIVEINVVNDMIPEIETTATINGEKEAFSAEKIVIDDTVEYKHLIPEKEYTIKGVIMNKETGEPFTVNNETIKVEQPFIPKEPNGSVVVSFEIDASVITEKTELVVFEELYKDGIQLAVHADLKDENQTVTIHTPEIKTTATINGTKNVYASEDFTIEDVVDYTDLIPGLEYKLVGTVMDKATGEPFLIDGIAVTSELVFTPDDSNGSVTVSFNFADAVITKNTNLVVFEELYFGDVEIANHKDINDEGQTVTIHSPEIKTTATINGAKDVYANETFVIDDVVDYTDLIPGVECKLVGTVMDKSTGKPFFIDGKTVTSELVFTPDDVNGSVIVSFDLTDAIITENTNLVVFEELYFGDVEIADHKDINDEDQTVTVHTPEIKTTATINGEKEVNVSEKITINDVVSYTDLIPGIECKLVGIVMNKATGKAFEVDGKPLTSELIFTPENSNGEITVSFTFDGSAIKETTELVVFETLYCGDVEIAVHTDISDKGQTVKINVPVPEKPPTPNTGDSRNYGTWIGIGAVTLGAAVSAVILKIKSKKDEDEY